jgi:threonine dehydrogenase-like Zn-dependent dehydrogenase
MQCSCTAACLSILAANGRAGAQDDVVLKVTSTCICGSDLHIYTGAMPGGLSGAGASLPSLAQPPAGAWGQGG